MDATQPTVTSLPLQSMTKLMLLEDHGILRVTSLSFVNNSYQIHDNFILKNYPISAAPLHGDVESEEISHYLSISLHSST